MIGSRIREFRKAIKLTMADMAGKIGISQGSLSDIENGKTRPSSDTLENIVRHTDISAQWLLIGDGSMFKGSDTEVIPLTKKSNGSAQLSALDNENQVMIPKYDIQASAGYGAYNSNEPVGQISLDRVFIEKELRASYRHLTSITVVGDSMEPTLRNGDVVIVDNSQTGGDGIFIVRAGEVLYIKRVQIFFDKGIMRLTSDNGFYEPMELDVKTENVKVVGRVVCCLRKI